MAFDSRDFLPVPSNWFSTTPEYEGWGRAEFFQPKGSLEGPVEVCFDELGRATVQMRPDLSTLHSERELRFGLDEFLSGAEPKKVDEQWILSRNLSQENPCTKLVVETSGGIFSTEDVSSYGASVVFGGNADGVKSLEFEVFLSRFDVEGTEDSKYWVLPLTNFVLEWRRREFDFDLHPLRIFPTPEVPDDITHLEQGPREEEAAIRAILALNAANSKNFLIGFELNGAPGFIECLPDYQNRNDNLVEGRERILPTAVMVGEVGIQSNSSLAELEPWLRPQDLLMLLTLATGAEIGTPWIELRDAQGRLVRRFHRQLRQAGFSRGYQLIDDLPFGDNRNSDTGIGYLISRAGSRFEDLGELPLRSSVLHLVRSKRRDQSLDESLAYLCRSLDGLCEHHRIAKQNLTVGLGENQKKRSKRLWLRHSGKLESSKMPQRMRETIRPARCLEPLVAGQLARLIRSVNLASL